MQGSHVGATGPLVTEIMRKAKGGVLFIDGELKMSHIHLNISVNSFLTLQFCLNYSLTD